MKKRYGQVVGIFIKLSMAAAVLLILSGVAVCITESKVVGIIEIILGVGIFSYEVILKRFRHKNVVEYLNSIAKENNAVVSNAMSTFPIPFVVAHIDGSIKWYNEKFSELFENRDMFDKMLDTLIPDIKWGNLLKSTSAMDKSIKLKDKQYKLIGTIVKDRNSSSNETEDKFSVYLYLIDETNEKYIEKLYNDRKTAIAIINIDNYEEVIQRVNDDAQQKIISQIRNNINKWAGEGNAVVKVTDRDRYFMVFENQYLHKYIENKFDVLEKIRSIGEDIKIPVSISIGIGCSGTVIENESFARNALDMALGRGGDQVCIKDDIQYKFYGGKTKEYEKSTRVKTRAVAVALKDFIKNSDKVIFMGHSSADYDCFGAAMGLQRAVRTLGKKPYIIYDGNSPAIIELYNELKEIEEYNGMFVDTEYAVEMTTANTLLVILDTHRPSMLPSREIVKNVSKIVLIDHHRRSTEFVNPCSLIYHEPYASSTCEMATELLEYMDLGGTLTTNEAECLYTGILMDTKNFLIKTGVRTFEAASYLRRLGLNTTAVKKLFNIDKKDYDRKVDIVKTSEKITQNIAVARAYTPFANIKVIASQAADEMLNIDNNRASFVVYPLDGCVGISARSLGDVNVQLIMESLGGGGHMTVAGAQIKDKSIERVVDDIKIAVNNYLKDTK